MDESAMSSGGISQRQSLEDELRSLVERERLNDELKDYEALRRQGDKLRKSSQCRVWRERVTEWFYRVVDQVEGERDIVFIAMNILDRFLAVAVEQEWRSDQKRYRLAAMTALLLSLKMCGRNSLGAESLAKMSSGAVKPEEVVSTAKTVVRALSWNRPLATPAAFLKGLAHTLPASTRQQVLTHALFLVELSVYDPFISTSKASDIAVAALLEGLAAQTQPTTTHAQAKAFLTRAQALTNSSTRQLPSLRSHLRTAFTRTAESDARTTHHITAPSSPQSPQLAPAMECRVVSSDDIAESSSHLTTHTIHDSSNTLSSTGCDTTPPPRPRPLQRQPSSKRRRLRP